MSKKAAALGKVGSRVGQRYKVRTRGEASLIRSKSLVKKKARATYKVPKEIPARQSSVDSASVLGTKMPIRPQSLASIGRMQLKYGSVLRRLAKR